MCVDITACKSQSHRQKLKAALPGAKKGHRQTIDQDAEQRGRRLLRFQGSI